LLLRKKRKSRKSKGYDSINEKKRRRLSNNRVKG